MSDSEHKEKCLWIFCFLLLQGTVNILDRIIVLMLLVIGLACSTLA